MEEEAVEKVGAQPGRELKGKKIFLFESAITL
jgi:hypothetical protein